MRPGFEISAIGNLLFRTRQLISQTLEGFAYLAIRLIFFTRFSETFRRLHFGRFFFSVLYVASDRPDGLWELDMQEGEQMIEFKHVSKTFHGKKIIDDISFQIPDGEFVVLLGESGCGKTTTLKMINKLILPSDGTVEINGRDISHMDTIALRRRMGYVIQQIGLFPHMTIRENIEIIARMKSKDKDRMEENAVRLMNMVNLDPATFMDAYPSEMSGGQQQRTLIARALCATDKLLVLDEPITGLDPSAIQDFYHMIKKLNREEQVAVLMVSHDIQNIVHQANKILHLKREVLFYGSVSDYVKSRVGQGFLGGEE